MPVVLPICSSVSYTNQALYSFPERWKRVEYGLPNAVFAPSSPRKNERSARIGKSRRGATDASMCPNQSVCPSLIPIKPCIPFQRGCIGWNMVCKCGIRTFVASKERKVGSNRKQSSGCNRCGSIAQIDLFFCLIYQSSLVFLSREVEKGRIRSSNAVFAPSSPRKKERSARIGNSRRGATDAGIIAHIDQFFCLLYQSSLVFLSREVEKGRIRSSNAVFAPASPRKNERSARIGNSRRGATDAGSIAQIDQFFCLIYQSSLVFLSREVEKGRIRSSNAVFAPSSPRKNESSARIGNSRRGATDASMCPNQSVCPSLIPIKPCIPFQRGLYWMEYGLQITFVASKERKVGSNRKESSGRCN